MPHVERFGAAVPPLRIQNILKKYLLKDFDFYFDFNDFYFKRLKDFADAIVIDFSRGIC